MILAGVLIFIIFQWIDVEKFLLVIQDVRVRYLILMCLLWPLSLYLSSLRWRVILGHYGIDLSMKEALSIYWVSSFFNNFLPTSIGGDTYRFLSLSRVLKDQRPSLVASILLDRGFGMVAMIFLVVFFGAFFWGVIIHKATLLIIYSLCVLILILCYGLAIFYPHLKIKRGFQSKIIRLTTDFFNTLTQFNDRKRIFYSLSLSVLCLILGVYTISLAFRSFGYDPPLMSLLFLIPLINLSELIPISINALGIKEGFALYLFSQLGIHAELVLSVFLVNRVLLMLVTSTGGIRYLFYRSTS